MTYSSAEMQDVVGTPIIGERSKDMARIRLLGGNRTDSPPPMQMQHAWSASTVLENHRVKSLWRLLTRWCRS